jgi:hypothetical protein
MVDKDRHQYFERREVGRGRFALPENDPGEKYAFDRSAKVVKGVQREDPERFALNYVTADNLRIKYIIARELLIHNLEAPADGWRYTDPHHLVEHFLPVNTRYAPRESSPFSEEEAKEMKDYLGLLLLEGLRRGQIDPSSEAGKVAFEQVPVFIDKHDDLRRLNGVLDPAMMQEITYALLFENITEEEKIKEYKKGLYPSILRPYLGDITFYRKRGELSFGDTLDAIPGTVLRDPDSLARKFARSYFTSEALRWFREGETEGFAQFEKEMAEQYLHDVQNGEASIKHELLREIYDEFMEVQKIEIPENFKTQVDWVEGWVDQELPFPHFRQKYFVHVMTKMRRQLLNGDTGSTKTACSYLTMESLGMNTDTLDAQSVVIFAPAKARNTWPAEAQNIFREGEKPDIYIIRDKHDFGKDEDDPSATEIEKEKRRRFKKAKYVCVGSEFISRAEKNSSLATLLYDNLLKVRETDGVIIDESDDFRNETAARTKIIVKFIKQAEASYALDPWRRNADGSTQKMPIVALTATPISNGLDDLDVTMALLQPERFALPKSLLNGYPEEPDKKTFSQTCLNNSRLAHTILYGEERIMTRWTQEDLFGDKVQRAPVPENLSVRVRPADLVIYDYIVEKASTTIAKKRLLTDILLNRQIVRMKDIAKLRKEVKEDEKKTAHLAPVPWNLEEMKTSFLELYDSWTEYSLKRENYSLAKKPFSEDWIAEFGASEFLIQAFFHPDLAEGVESLIDLLAGKPGYASLRGNAELGVRGDWERREVVSDKFEALQHFLAERILKNDSGEYDFSRQVFVVIPYHQLGITRGLHGKKVIDTAVPDFGLSLYELITQRWFPGLPLEKTACIDSNTSFDKRSEIATSWRHNKTQLVVATMGTVNESMNWAVDGGVDCIWLSRPWSADEEIQMQGRFLRPGQGGDYQGYFVDAFETIDKGLKHLTRRKYLLTQVALAGVKLTDEDRALLETKNDVLVIAQPLEGQFFIRDVINRMQGMGEKKFVNELSRGENGHNYFQKWAEAYYDGGSDTERLVAGNNARFVTETALRDVLQTVSQPKILSVGAGSCLVARCLNETGARVQMENLDLNGYLLEMVQKEHPEIGKVVVGAASEMYQLVESTDGEEIPVFLPENYDAVESSLMLDLTSHRSAHSERVEILKNIVNAGKKGSTVVFTFPNSAMDAATYAGYVEALENHFGLSIVREKSGQVVGVDYKPHRPISYAITGIKTGDISLEGFDFRDLRLLTDAPERVSKYKESSRNGKVTVLTREHPVAYHEFKVRDPLTKREVVYGPWERLPAEEVITSAVEQRTDEVHISGATVVFAEAATTEESEESRTLDDLWGDLYLLRKDSFQRDWVRNWVRGVKERFAVHWEIAEQAVYTVLLESEIGLPSSWENTIQERKMISRSLRNKLPKIVYNLTQESEGGEHLYENGN